MSRFVVETPKLVIEALQSPLTVEYIIIRSGDLGMRELLWAAEDAGATVYELDKRAFDGLADAKTPQPALAIVGSPVLTLDDRFARSDGRGGLFVLVDVADPGNVGTLIRTAEASGMAGVLFAGRTADALSPKVVRSSAGSVLRVPLAEVRAEDPQAIVDALRPYVDEVYATAMEGTPFTEVSGSNNAYVLGSEAHGLAAEMIEAVDRSISIPMHGQVESLNVATAGAVLAFHR